VLDKRNGGKADALNAGINFARMELVCVIDADVLLDRRALFSLALPFVEDGSTVASSGTIRLHNGCRYETGRIRAVGLPHRLVERIQIVEYIRAFGLGRLFFNALGAHLLISGAFGLFRRSVLAEIGGFQPTAIGEDMELVLRIHRHLRAQARPYRITFVADALCFTEGPHGLRDLGRQRTRWHQGLLTSLRLHRSMMLNPKMGALGWIAMPYFVAFELLAPVIETLGWLGIPLAVALGLVQPIHLGLFGLAAVALGTGVSLIAIALDDLYLAFYPRLGQLLGLAWSATLEHLGYHQATLWFRLRAFARFYGSIHIRGGWVSPKRQARR
jgi:cellulose synthase/poly-beta-1,6-N-acetylglucosamine synthase-like glycosyltransferase